MRSQIIIKWERVSFLTTYLFVAAKVTEQLKKWLSYNKLWQISKKKTQHFWGDFCKLQLSECWSWPLIGTLFYEYSLRVPTSQKDGCGIILSFRVLLMFYISFSQLLITLIHSVNYLNWKQDWNPYQYTKVIQCDTSCFISHQ